MQKQALRVVSISLVGSSNQGPINRLPGFDKKRHRVPTEVNDHTERFLSRLVEHELQHSIDQHFRLIRQALNYKRCDISANCQLSTGSATTKDFNYTLQYAIDSQDPSCYCIHTTLSEFKKVDFFQNSVFNELFQQTFDTLEFQLNQPLEIESIIDSFEEDTANKWVIDYPFDCTHCKVELLNGQAQAHFENNELLIKTNNRYAPSELLNKFQEIRSNYTQFSTFLSSESVG